MFTYRFWARTCLICSFIYFYKEDNNGAIYFTNAAIVLAILETAKKEKE